MEEIEQIIDFIIKELNLIDDDSKSFLRGLAQENDYINDYHQSIRLLICIGIDLKYKLVDKNVMKPP